MNSWRGFVWALRRMPWTGCGQRAAGCASGAPKLSVAGWLRGGPAPDVSCWAQRAPGPLLSDGSLQTVSWGLAWSTDCLLPLATCCSSSKAKEMSVLAGVGCGEGPATPARANVARPCGGLTVPGAVACGTECGRLLFLELSPLSHEGVALDAAFLGNLRTAVGSRLRRARMLASLAAPLNKQPIWFLLRKPNFLSVKCFEYVSIGKS